MNIQEILKEHNIGVTAEISAIFDFLKTKNLSAYSDIMSNFTNFGRISMFRTFNLLLSLRVIKKVDLGDKVMTYKINNIDNAHEYMKCKICNSIMNFYADEIYKKIFDAAKKIGFEIKQQNIGVLGTCKNVYSIKTNIQ
ncbi:MAG: hypothetical protein GY828_07815 [Candidatus Gracilibacteria bacterium]|nr:hypothetical protein [Candidatus Gracilibacteria bacterium]MCP4524097.1 hypothetical protein [Candidatus Gracilibacteria bacterium]